MEKFKDLFAESRSRTFIIIGVLVVALAVPITVRLVGQQQDLRQQAADSERQGGSTRGFPKKDNGEKCNSNSECKSSLCGVKYQFGQAVNVCVATAPQDDDEDEKECGSWYSAGGSCTVYDGQNNTEQGEEWKRTCTVNGDEIIETKCEASSDSNTGDEEGEEENNEDVDCNGKGVACGPGVQCCAGLYCGSGMCKEFGGGDSGEGDDGDPVSNPGRGGSNDSPWWRPGGGSNGGDAESDNNTSQPRPTATRTPTPTQVPACGASCNNANACAGAPNGCTVCEGIPLLGGTILFGTCKPGASTTPTVTTTISPSPSTTVSPTTSVTRAPSPTPTTPAGACGTRCTSDSQCGGGADGCGQCVKVGQTQRMTCQRNGITPTPSTGPNDVSLTLNLKMPGIGQNTGDNQNPNNPNRTTQVVIYNASNEEVGNTSGTSQFDGTGTYTATLSSSQVSGGVYYLKARFDNTLMTRVPGVVQLTEGQTTNTPVTTLIPGDLNNDNIIDIRDFNKFIACYGDLQCAEKSLADFNDDGQVGPVDYNILLRSFAIREGD